MKQNRILWLKMRIKLYEAARRTAKVHRPYDNALTFFKGELRRELVKDMPVIPTEHQQNLSSIKKHHKHHKTTLSKLTKPIVPIVTRWNH